MVFGKNLIRKVQKFDSKSQKIDAKKVKILIAKCQNIDFIKTTTFSSQNAQIIGKS
jgi:hypothetical protein